MSTILKRCHIQSIEKKRNMFRNKPTVGSVCGGICRALPTSPEHSPETLSSYILLEKYAINFHKDIYYLL